MANAQQLHVQQGHDKCSRHYVCPPEFLRLSQNCYYFSKDRSSWQDAYFSCRDRHGKLAMLRSPYEDKMLRTFLNKVSLGNNYYLPKLDWCIELWSQIPTSIYSFCKKRKFAIILSLEKYVCIASHQRWIGGMYDWEQMMWKWPSSGKEIKYKGFSRVNQEKEENLQWHCIVLDPHLQYK